ncbi:DNA polymerase [Ktedonobacteria bacterium brp13]|nr:DNA polymerase [Ktedonobacteria bacterium brp13]
MGKEQRRMEVYDAEARYYPSGTLALEQLAHWIAFSRVLGIGPVRFQRLLDYFQDDARAAWLAESKELAQAGLEQKIIERFQQQRIQIKPLYELERLYKLQVKVITWRDNTYPPLLRKIEYAPPVLYICGTLIPDDFIYSIGVVGTRKMSAYGRHVTETFTRDLVHGSMTIVSGLALGIDTVAHTTALNQGGRTIAVMASGLDVIYPTQNRALAARIAESGQGALLTPFPLGVNPEAGNFPARNHIISGLSLGILVVEAPNRSGSLITANSALTQGREVYAVPANITAKGSEGVNKLIRDGAHPVTCVADILEHLNIHAIPTQPVANPNKQPTLWAPPTAPVRQPANDEERTICATLSDQPLHIDEIIRKAQLPAHAITSLLTIMELDGMVRQIKTMCYIRTVEE